MRFDPRYDQVLREVGVRMGRVMCENSDDRMTSVMRRVIEGKMSWESWWPMEVEGEVEEKVRDEVEERRG